MKRKVFYIITIYQYALSHIYKIGFHTGDIKAFITRYQTYYPKMIIYYFQYVDNADEIEAALKQELYEYRIDNYNGHKSELFEIEYNKLYKIMKNMIDNEDDIIIDRLADIDLSNTGRKSKVHNKKHNKAKKISTEDPIGDCTDNDNIKISIGSSDIRNKKKTLIPCNRSHLSRLSKDEEINIFGHFLNYDLMTVMFMFTHAALGMFKYHNIGYTNMDSKSGYIFYGDKFIEKPIKEILQDICEYRLRDIINLYNRREKFFTDNANQIIKAKLNEMDKILHCNRKKFKQLKKDMFARLKEILYTYKEFFLESYVKTKIIDSSTNIVGYL